MTYYFAYLDEFGHIGPYVTRQPPRHNDSPVFGLAGFVMPSEHLRGFGTWFFQRKCDLLAFEIERLSQHPGPMGKEGGQPLHRHERDPIRRAQKAHEPAVQQDRHRLMASFSMSGSRRPHAPPTTTRTVSTSVSSLRQSSASTSSAIRTVSRPRILS